jgi:hypothetical protein
LIAVCSVVDMSACSLRQTQRSCLPGLALLGDHVQCLVQAIYLSVNDFQYAYAISVRFNNLD